jgi:ribonucleoside-diphosphate reductase alpha chain
MSDEQAAITRLVSTSLRHGADIKFIVEQLNKCDGDIFSFTKGLARILKKYIPNGAKSTIQCSNCNSKNIVFEEGCNKCLDCGNSKCN